MAETKNIDEIAGRLSKDIFKHFLWATHPKTDDNFECANEKHVGEGGKPKATHPGDVVFHYRDPYLGKTVYLHTCWVPCDHWPIRSWPLYRARQVMREVLSNQTRGATT